MQPSAWRTERILADRLTELGGAVDRGVAAVSLDAQADTVLVELQRVDGTLVASEADWVIGAGGAHSVTRSSMTEHLDGDTYPGTALVADVGVGCAVPRDGSAFIAHEVAWASPFRMQRRLAPRLEMGRRFLLGDAGHLSSPFGGEGLNAGLHDAHDLAWKLALDVRGRSRPALLKSFEFERVAAARHALDVSDRIHQGAKGAVDAARTGIRRGSPSPDQVAALARARYMLDVSYAGSPLLGEHVSADVSWPAAPTPGERHPQRTTLSGTNHHLLVCGDADEERVDRLSRRWGRPGHHRSNVGRASPARRRADGYLGGVSPRSETVTTQNVL